MNSKATKVHINSTAEIGAGIKKLTKQSWINVKEYIFIAIGLFLYAGAWKAFLLPHQITGGGVTGVGALAFYATGIPISVTYFSINAVLLLISIKTIGLKFSLRTIFGVALMTLFFSVMPQAVSRDFCRGGR